MYILIDIGGTHTRFASSTDLKSFNEPVKILTPPDYHTAINEYSHHINRLTRENTLTALVVGLPGVTDEEGSITASPNLSLWINQPLKRDLTAAAGAPIQLVNDAALGGLGEAVYGAGRDHSIAAYLTISTGVGGARIVNGKIDTASQGFEPGHQIIDLTHTICPDCPTPTTLEHVIGGANVAKRFNCHPKDIKDPAVWNNFARYLAVGLNNVSVLWSPDVIILGGPMMNDIPIDTVRQTLANDLKIFASPPPVKNAELADKKAFWGALALLNKA